MQGPGQGAIYNTISHTRRGYRHQNCSRLIILNGYREGATLRTAFSLALNQEGRGREGWAKCTAKANGKSKIIVFAFFIIQHECIDGEREQGMERGRARICREKKKKGRAAPDIGRVLPVVTQKHSRVEKCQSRHFYFLAEHLCCVLRFLDVKFKRKTFNCSDRTARRPPPPCATGHC